MRFWWERPCGRSHLFIHCKLCKAYFSGGYTAADKIVADADPIKALKQLLPAQQVWVVLVLIIRAPFNREQLNHLLDLALTATAQLAEKQCAALEAEL